MYLRCLACCEAVQSLEKSWSGPSAHCLLLSWHGCCVCSRLSCFSAQRRFRAWVLCEVAHIPAVKCTHTKMKVPWRGACYLLCPFWPNISRNYPWLCNLPFSTIRLCRKVMKDEIKPLEAPAVAYINTSLAVQMHHFSLVKVSATKNAGVIKRKKHSYFYLRKSLKIYCKLTMRRSCAKIKAGARSVAGPALQPVMCVPVMWSHACLRVYTNLPPLRPFCSLCKWSIGSRFHIPGNTNGRGCPCCSKPK